MGRNVAQESERVPRSPATSPHLRFGAGVVAGECHLYSQIRRVSKNVTGNIAEAYGRYHYLDSLHYYSIAHGELNETLSRLIEARVLEYIP